VVHNEQVSKAVETIMDMPAAYQERCLTTIFEAFYNYKATGDVKSLGDLAESAIKTIQVHSLPGAHDALKVASDKPAYPLHSVADVIAARGR